MDLSGVREGAAFEISGSPGVIWARCARHQIHTKQHITYVDTYRTALSRASVRSQTRLTTAWCCEALWRSKMEDKAYQATSQRPLSSSWSSWTRTSPPRCARGAALACAPAGWRSTRVQRGKAECHGATTPCRRKHTLDTAAGGSSKRAGIALAPRHRLLSAARPLAAPSQVPEELVMHHFKQAGCNCDDDPQL